MAKNITKLKHRFPIKQLRRIPRILIAYWPALILIAFTVVLCFLNFSPNTILTGWDNLHPEFSPLMNLKRSIFSVWEEYQSLGLLAGMAHAADLPKNILVWVLSLTPVPLSLFRYGWTFSMLLIGPLGVYFTLDSIILKGKFDSSAVKIASFLGGLYYLLNLSTLQTFFTPYDSFTGFYGFMPWLVFALLNYLHRPSLKNGAVLFGLSLLSSPSFYNETMFIVIVLCFLPIFLQHIIGSKKYLKESVDSIKALFIFTLPHLYWLLPVIFFVLSGSHVTTDSKINLIASPETYARNLEFANLQSLGLMKGFWFNFLDLGQNNSFDYLLRVWRTHLSTTSVSLIGYLLFIITCTGLYYSLKKKILYSRSIFSILIICAFFLLGGGLLINQSIPLIGELFRSPFTKFSIPLSFASSYLFAIGCIFILDLFSFLHSRLTNYATPFTIALLLIIFTSPFFSGNLISSSMRLSPPAEYQSLFEFFQDQDPATRIANFPQANFWGWLYYDWGYRGSGFLWYGIKQPILDRAFDVWSKESESYYEEISSAVYSEDWTRFDEIIDKYSVNWILIDHHVIAPEGKIDLKTKVLEEYLSDNPNYTLSKNFNDSILVYQTQTNKKTNNFISTSSKSLTVTPFNPINLRPNTSFTLTSNTIILPQVTLANSSGFTLNLPSLTTSESLIPVLISYQKAYGILSLKLEPQAPKIMLNNQDVSSSPLSTFISIPVSSTTESLILQIGQDFFELQLPAEITEFLGYYPIGGTYLSSKQPFLINLYDGDPQTGQNLTPELKNATPYQCYTDKPNRKIEKIVSGDTIALLGTDVVGCLSAPLPETTLPGIYSVDFSYFSPTQIPGNVNVTNLNLGSNNYSQPLETATRLRHTRIFAFSSNQPQKINLLLEANESKSVQEINYSNVSLYFHPQIFSGRSSFNSISKKTIPLSEKDNTLSISLPIVSSPFDIIQTPSGNQLLPESLNCDQFNSGPVKKTVSQEGITYESQNSIACDYLNLRHLPHSLNYLISFDYLYQSGLPMTLCLENHSTRRCDIYERLQKTDTTQHLIQPIRNDSEDQGFTLHLFNQSVGNRITKNTIKKLSIHPLPLHFLQDISLTSPITRDPKKSDISTTHPAEFLYTVQSSSSQEQLLNLYQSKSDYWIALKVNPQDLKASLLTTIVKLPTLYFSNLKLQKYDTGINWYNSWTLPEGDYSIIIFYAPQYLQFIGFALIPIFLILTFLISLPMLFKPIKNRLVKKHKR